jgi:PPOX class probable F420-dependent enzyme
MRIEEMLSEETPFTLRAKRHLINDPIVWFTTVDSRGRPQPNPVWFLWNGAEALLIYNKENARRLRHVASNANVAVNFNVQTGDVLMLTGTAHQVEAGPAHENQEYVKKYGPSMVRIAGSAEQMGLNYPVALEVIISGIRGR